jgi:hypothetical protein
MRLAVLAALGAVTIAAAAGAGLGWRYAPDSSDAAYSTRLVLATVPTGPPTYVQPQCAVTPQPAFRPLGATPADSGTPQTQTAESQKAGRVPPDFAPVRAVRCEEGFEPGGFTVIQSETQSATDLQTLLASLKPSRIQEPVGPILMCPAIGVVPLAIALVDAHGGAVRVDLPRDQCNLYVESALQTLNTVHWTVTGTTKAPLPS